MKDVAKLKKKAAEFELKKQFDKALAVYVEILDSYGANDDIDVSLFNRVGDLYLKQGSVGDAVDYYEQAVDRYAESGFHNNAIALCNKILRNSPGRASVYYRLGKISAQKGFKSDAKKNFLEYADRMQSSGKIDEAFRALKEFADLCPDQDDIRLMLAEQLSKKGRGAEAIEQLQMLHARYMEEGREAEARATLGRMKAIDPAAEPLADGAAVRHSAGDLVFLDLGDSTPKTSQRTQSIPSSNSQALEFLTSGVTPPIPAPVVAPVVPAPTPEVLETPALEPAVLDGVTRAAEFDLMRDDDSSETLVEGLQSTSLDSDTAETEASELLDYEATSLTPVGGSPVIEPSAGSMPNVLDFDMQIGTPSDLMSQAPVPDALAATPERLETVDFVPRERDEPSLVARPSLADLPLIVDEHGVETPAQPVESIGGELNFILPDGTPASGVDAQPSVVDDLPLMDIELPMPGEATAAISGAPVLDLEAQPFEIDSMMPGLQSGLADAESPVASANFGEATFETMEVVADVDKADTDSEDDDAYMPAARRESTVMAAHDVDMLKALCESDPEDNLLRRRLAEAMLESGDREGGIRELEAAMVGFERADDLTAAGKVADEIVLLNPDSVRHHQKRVEYAFRTNDREHLIEAYLQLADALFRAGQEEKSRAIYQRVIDLSPDDVRAQTALESFPEPEAAPAPPPTAAPKPRSTVATSRAAPAAPVAPPPKPSPVPRGDDSFVNLGDWLRDDEAPKDTRMVVNEQEPTGDEEADFQDMLRKFKQGISENVDEEDHQSHYDLGVAYKEMGLLDEAISEFQKALRAPTNRVPAYEALGQCFMEKEQYPMAATILGRALHEKGISEDQLVGVLYLLGRCAEERGQREVAVEYYQRVFVVDIQFQDVGDRLAAVEGARS
jgi:tetratricopeptide (TPR) repeat protein